MRVLVLHNAYAQPGGEDVVVRAEVDALRARGHEVHVLSRASAELHESVVRGVAETVITAANLHAGIQVDCALRTLRPDVVHVHNLFPRFGPQALRACLARGLPVVQTLHNFRWLCAKATRWRDDADCNLCARGTFLSAVRHACVKRNRIASAAYAVALTTARRTHLPERSIARFVCVSNFVRTVHSEAGFAADRPHSLVVKGHFVAHAPGPDGPGDGSVVFAGRLSEEKGLATLARACARMPAVSVKIAGDGPERAAWQARFAAAGAHVQWLGRLSPDALAAVVQRSSVSVVPSLGNETFGLAALEAFACGRPVVATDAGGLPELVQEGRTGHVVRRGDDVALAARVMGLLSDPDRARSMGDAGLQLVRRAHLPDSNLLQLESIYTDAIAEHRK